MMTKSSWIIISLATYLVASVCVVEARTQGDSTRPFDRPAAAVRRPGTEVRIDLIGDSTQTDNAGYGRGFCANFTVKVDCVNMARGGGQHAHISRVGAVG
jgi:hypothetical protein